MLISVRASGKESSKDFRAAWARFGVARRARFDMALGAMLSLIALANCGGGANLGAGKPALNVTSSSFQAGAIPKQCTCDGGDNSPELAWDSAPAGTQSFALITYDKDSRFNSSFTHWVLFDLPTDKRELPEGLPKLEQLPDGSRQGPNDFDKTGYAGPCPPGKSPHRYAFTLYALDSKLNLAAGATRKQLEKAIAGHVLAYGEVVGSYQH